MKNDFFHSDIFKAILLVGTLIFLWQVWEPVALLILALAIASALDYPIDYMERRGWPRLLSAALLYILLVGGAITILVFVIPSLTQQIDEIRRELPYASERLGSLFRFLGPLEISYDFIPSLGELLGVISGKVVDSLVALVRTITSLVMVVVLSFYLVVRRDGVADFLRLLIPFRYETYVINLWTRTNRKLGRWLQGQFLLGLAVAILVYIGLKIIGVPFALILAILAGVLELVPFVGPVIAAIPAVIYGFSQSAALGLLLALFYLLVQQFENHFLVPAVTRKMTGLNPIIAIISLIVGGTLGGVLGVLIAIPVTVALAEVLDDWAARKSVERGG